MKYNYKISVANEDNYIVIGRRDFRIEGINKSIMIIENRCGKRSMRNKNVFIIEKLCN